MPLLFKRFHRTSLLSYLGVYNQNFFNSLLNSLKSPWEYVRNSAQDILMEFPNDYMGVSTTYLSQDLLPCALSLTNHFVMRHFEAGARLMFIIAKKFIDKVDFSLLAVNPETSEKMNNLPPILKFGYYILARIKSKFENLQKHFLEDEAEFSNNLVHGLITTLGFLLKEYSKNDSIKNKEQAINFKHFFKDLCDTIEIILLYTTKLSADQLVICILNNDARVKELNEQVQSILL